MRYQVFIDCEGDDDEAYPRPDWLSLSEKEKKLDGQGAAQTIGAFYCGVFEADSPDDALAMARQWIDDSEVFVLPGA